MNATFQIVRELGWGYLEKLAKQRILQVQSATDTPKKIALGERAIMVDGAGYLIIRNKEAGQPVDVIYPAEGTPLATGPSAVFKAAPNPNAARLFQNWLHSREGQQILVDYARQYSPHSQTVEKPGVRKLADIKLMKEDPVGVENATPRRSRGATRRFSRCEECDRDALAARPRAGSGGTMSDAVWRSPHPGRACSTVTIALPAEAARRPVRIDLSWPILIMFAAALCVLIILPMTWLALLQPGRPRPARSRWRTSRRWSPIRCSSGRCITTLILAGSSSVICCLAAAPMALAGGAHRHAAAAHRAHHGDGVLRHAAVSRRDRLGAPGGAQFGPHQQGLAGGDRRARWTSTCSTSTRSRA